MPFLQRNWLRFKDQFYGNDERVGDNPNSLIKKAERESARMSPDERQKSLEHIAAGLDTYYIGRHRMEHPPSDVIKDYQKLSQRVATLNRLNAAEQVLAKYGGPPTSKTLENSIERSKGYYAELNKGFDAKYQKVDALDVYQRQKTHIPVKERTVVEAQTSAPNPTPKLRAHSVQKEHSIAEV